MAKSNKQEELNDDVSFGFDNIKKADQKINKKDNSPEFRFFNLIIHKDLNNKFDTIFLDFMRESGSYKYNKSKTIFFGTCVDFLVQEFEKTGEYISANNEFLEFISRPGRRPKSERHFPKEEAESLYIRVSPEHFNKYNNLLFSFLSKKNDPFNRSYSVSYFFHDFIDLIKKNFKKMVKQYSD